MSQAERRYDRLSVRLSLIISRLLAGETLNMRKLAAEFGVSECTLHRDFRERLIYLDLEYQDGCCRLLTGGRQEIRVEAVRRFGWRPQCSLPVSQALARCFLIWTTIWSIHC